MPGGQQPHLPPNTAAVVGALIEVQTAMRDMVAAQQETNAKLDGLIDQLIALVGVLGAEPPQRRVVLSFEGIPEPRPKVTR